MPRKGFRFNTGIVKQETSIRVTHDTRAMISKFKLGDEPIGDVVRRVFLDYAQKQQSQKNADALEEQLWALTSQVVSKTPVVELKAKYKV